MSINVIGREYVETDAPASREILNLYRPTHSVQATNNPETVFVQPNRTNRTLFTERASVNQAYVVEAQIKFKALVAHAATITGISEESKIEIFPTVPFRRLTENNASVSTTPAATYVIPASTADRTLDMSYVPPGSIVELEAGLHGELEIQNLQGTQASPIIVRSDPNGRVEIRRQGTSNGWFTWIFTNCWWFEIDGSTTNGETYGFLLTLTPGDYPSQFLKAWQDTNKWTVHHIEIDGSNNPDWNGTYFTGGATPIGISTNTPLEESESQWDWKEDIHIYNNYIHHVSGEAIYAGENYELGGEPINGLPCRRIYVHHNICEYTGRDAINLKSGLADPDAGFNYTTVHCYENLVRFGGRRRNVAEYGLQAGGIYIFEGGANVYNNKIFDVSEHGISYAALHSPGSRGPVRSRIYNNLIVRTGLGNDTYHQTGDGIQAGSQTDFQHILEIYNNTIVSPEEHGIDIGWSLTSGNVVYDNIGVNVPGNLVDNTSSQTSIYNNDELSANTSNFSDPSSDDYHLAVGSPAIDNASGPSPAEDLDGVLRPQGSGSDQGCYEYVPSRNLLAEMTFETGFLKSPSSITPDADGIYRDYGHIFGAETWDSPITITNISKANPAIVTFTGSMPDPGSGDPTYTETPGFTLGEITSGMTEMSGRIIRPKNISGNTFEAWQDGDDDGYNPTQTVEGNTPVDSTGYGTWSGSVQAQAYRRYVQRQENLRYDSNEYPGFRVHRGSFLPPDTINGAGNVVTALEGNHFLGIQINYWIDHSRAPELASGLWNNEKNKPRNQILWGNPSLKVPEATTNWFGIGLYLPSNFDLTSNTRTGDLGQTGLVEQEDDPSTAMGNVWLLNLTNSSSAQNVSWHLDAILGSGNSVEGIYLANPIEDEDLGKWTVFVVQSRIDPNGGTGILKIWKSFGPHIESAESLNDREMRLVYNRVNAPVGFISTYGNWDYGLKQYKFAWHHWTNTGDSHEQFIGFDSARWGSEEVNNTNFSEVHPFKRPERTTYVITGSWSISDVNALSLSPGDRVLFTAGLTWNVTSESNRLQCRQGVYYGRIGPGAAPRIDGGSTSFSINRRGVVHIDGVDDVTIDGLDITCPNASGNEGFLVCVTSANNVSIRNCRLHHSPGGGLCFFFCDGIKVRNTEIDNVDGNPNESLTFYESSNGIVEYCHIHDNGHAAINTKDISRNIEVRYCKLERTTNDPMFYVERAANVRYHHNYIKDNNVTGGTYKALVAFGIEGFNDEDSRYNDNIELDHNVIYSSQQYGINVVINNTADKNGSAPFTIYMNDIHIHHNTIVSTGISGENYWHCIHFADGRDVPDAGDWTNLVVEDNIFWDTNAGKAIDLNDGITLTTVRYNLYQTGETSDDFGTNYVTTSDVKFNDLGNEDFTLDPLSPAVGQASDGGNIGADLDVSETGLLT